MPNPVPGGSIGRTDEGVDISAPPGSAINDPVPGTSRYVGEIPNWYNGQPYYWFQVVSGPFKGAYWYVAEQISAAFRSGQQFVQGQRIGSVASSGTGLEFGWAEASGQTKAQATTGYTEGQVTPAGTDFRNRIINAAGGVGGAASAAGAALNWQPCTLTWYDPALGGTNSASGAANPTATMANGQPYSPSAMTCAAPPNYAFGTQISFRYGGKVVTCTVTDRGGAIQGTHFDLARAPATQLGIISQGMVQAEFAVGGSGGSGGGGGKNRPGGSTDTGAAVDQLLVDYHNLRDINRAAPPSPSNSPQGIGPSLVAAGLWFLSAYQDAAAKVFGP